MRMQESAEAFKSFLGSRDLDVTNVAAVAAINAWIDFYKAQRFDDVTEGLDWLWFQFGTYDWGDGASFQVDLTRQLILQDETDDDAIWQLRFVLHYPPEPAFGDGIETCEDVGNAEAFKGRVLASSTVARVTDVIPDRVELLLGNAG